jgi:hypothetical protein
MTEISKEVSIFEDAIIKLFEDQVEVIPEMFDLSAGTWAAIMGQVIGRALACRDEIKEHPEIFRKTFMRNFDDGYAAHRAKHDKIRASMTDADQMLNKVCESHMKKGT